MPVWLFAVSGEEVDKARAHITGQVLNDDRDGIRLFIKCDKQFFIFKLRHRAFRHVLVPAKLPLYLFEIVSCQVG